MSDDILSFDVILVGAGPANLACAIRLLQLSRQKNITPPSIAIFEKGKAVGAHILSGAVIDPRALRELYPDFESMTDCPVKQKVTGEKIKFLTRQNSWTFPWIPSALSNRGNYVISLSALTVWLAKQAEVLGVEILTSFAVTDLIYEGERVVGVVTGAKGVGKDGQPKSNYEAPMEVRAKVVVLGEGAYGSVTQKLIHKFDLQKTAKVPQTYATAVKEVWEVPVGSFPAGEVWTTLGFPLPLNRFGGCFVYGQDERTVSIGLVLGLDPRRPDFDQQGELQKFRNQPQITQITQMGKLISYGAKTIPEGGYFALGKISVPGCLLVGDSAGFVNVPHNKGIHLAMKSGILAAEAIFDEVPEAYLKRVKASYIWKELYGVRHFQKIADWGLRIGDLMGRLREIIQRYFGFKKSNQYYAVVTKNPQSAIRNPQLKIPLGNDKLTALSKSGVAHTEDQPSHLLVADTNICATRCLTEFGNPCQRFCPAHVYEMLDGQLHINASNCVHCKTCEIVDPYQLITWVPPEAGGGPGYVGT